MRNGSVLLREIGVTLYGNGWEGQVAKDLAVDPRLVRRWINGGTMIPDAIWPRLRKKLQFRKLALEALVERLG